MTPRYNDVGVLDLFDVEPLTPGEVNGVLGLSSDEIIIDCFAGGGGASLGIEWATGRSPDEAINHSASAIAIHKANHPRTNHHHSDVWEVDPVAVARGRKVGLLWMSPDCTHHSRAKGGKPVSRRIRALAHVAVRYAKKVRPRVIGLENVQEFLSWGPISRRTGKPDPSRKGHSFRTFVRQLKREGYHVETKLLRGCDFGSPTTRLRLFLVARCDGQPIRWPTPSHGKQRPDMWAASIMDWSLPCPSIFLTKDEAAQAKRELRLKRAPKRPLAEATMKRIARGLQRYVIDAADPFVVPIEYLGDLQPGESVSLMAPSLIQTGYGEDKQRNGGKGQAPRSLDIKQPIGTVVGGGSKHAIVAAWLAKHFGDRGQRPGSSMLEPIDTITGIDHHSLCAAHLVKLKGTCRDGQPVTTPLATVQAQGNHHGLVTAHIQRDFGQSVGSSMAEPLPTITGSAGGHVAEVRAFLVAYFGQERDGQSLKAPMRTVTPKDRLGLVTIHGTDYVIVDIGLRMVSIRERARAQGFPDSYVLDVLMPVERQSKKRGRYIVMKRLSEEAQGEMIGNSVNPHVACALLLANFGAPVAQERAA